MKTVPLGKQENRKSFLNELDTLGASDHPHIVKGFAATESQTAGMGYLVLELCRGGDLFEHVSQNRGLGETEAARLARQMLLAVAYLHSRRVVHRDVKTENFLFLEKSRENLKLCDFGTARVLGDERETVAERIGTLSYAAPEVYTDIGSGMPSDLWSLGAVIYVMLCASSPFRAAGATQQATIARVRVRGGSSQQPRSRPIGQILHGSFSAGWLAGWLAGW